MNEKALDFFVVFAAIVVLILIASILKTTSEPTLVPPVKWSASPPVCIDRTGFGEGFCKGFLEAMDDAGLDALCVYNQTTNQIERRWD